MNTLFKNIKALLPDAGSIYTVKDCNVYVEGDTISSVNQAPEGFSADTVIDGKGRLLIPGFINSHTHVYMTMFRNCADDLAFTDWLFNHINPLEDKMTAEDCYWGSLLGYMEMLSTGTTSSLDMFVFPETAARAAEEAGVRAVLCRGLTGGADDVSGGERRLREARDEISKRRSKNSLISYMLGPHAPYTCDPGYLREVLALSKELKLPLNIHVAEGRDEIKTIKDRYNFSPAEYLDNLGILSDTTVAAHCVYLTEGDIRLFAERGVSIATNPASNLKLGNGIAPVPKMLEAGINVCLGTDGAASNNTLNMFRELSLLTLLHKGTTEDPTTISAAQGIKIATANGARALGLGGLVGEIRPGMKADLIVINIDKPHMKPHNNILSSLAYSANGSEVETVMVNGRLLLKDGEYLTIDKERVLYEVDKTCRRMGLI
ncbi:MAG: amidohydrolase [Papillibacter sp.]|nr:amidohydrolase [Papillibacter sp.]